LLVIVLIALGTVCTPSPACAVDLDSLLANSVGGPAAVTALRGVTSFRGTGTVKINDQPGQFVLSVAMPDKLHLQVDMMGFSITQAFDGSVGWQRDFNGQVSELSGFEYQEIVNQAYFQTYSYLFDGRIGGGKQYVGVVTRDGVAYHQVDFYPLYLDTVSVLFDQTTGLQAVSIGYMDNMEMVSTSDDYRAVGGFLTSFHSVAAATGAPLSSDFQVDSLMVNHPVDLNLFRKPGTSAADFRFPAGVDSVLVPFELVTGHIYVGGVINGTRKVRFILDSGASANVYHAPALDGLAVEIVGEIAAKGISGYEKVQMVRTDSVAVGDLVLLGQTGGSVDMTGIGRDDGDIRFGGVLGYDFLSRFPILVDYPGSRLIVYNPERFAPPEGGAEVPFTLTMQVPTIRAELAGVAGDYIVDLGNAFGVIVHHDYARRTNLLARLDDVETFTDRVAGLGGSVAGKSAFAATFSFGDIRVNSLRVILPESSEGLAGSTAVAGNIGNLFLRQFRVLFDYAGRRLLFYDGESTGP
ncbi:MAG: retroviral-like aspartic protease family protein, partial [candidate division Zixibacteria bacterium]|nr:retroviral-like aspartic protease family protein [candidate division Zixibacteria bacterium]